MNYKLLYRSISNGFLSKNQIDVILKASHKNNKLKNITGFLIYKEKYFLQLLEGPKKEVKELYKKIGQDIRHSNCEILIEFEGNKRIFPEWNMGHLEGEKLTTKNFTLNNIIKTVLGHNQMDDNLVLDILKSFTSKNSTVFDNK